MPLMMMTPREMVAHIAKEAKARRLSLNLSQKTVSQRSGVSHSSLKKFERTGQISLESLLKLALILGTLDTFTHVFAGTKENKLTSLDDIIKDTPRKRGRQ